MNEKLYMPMQIMWWIELSCQPTINNSNGNNDIDDNDELQILLQIWKALELMVIHEKKS